MTAPHPHYPVQLDLRGRPVLVVGAGRVAATKIERLVPTGAEVTVVAPDAGHQVTAQIESGSVRWHQRPYQRGEVASYRLAITCTGNPEIDGQVYTDGEATSVWVCSADDVDHCAFTLPAVARRGPLTVAVGTGGRSPALASWLRRRFQADLDDGMDALLEILATTRTELRRAAGHTEHPGWRAALDHGLLDQVRAGHHSAARRHLRSALDLPPEGPSSHPSTTPQR